MLPPSATKREDGRIAKDNFLEQCSGEVGNIFGYRFSQALIVTFEDSATRKTIYTSIL